MKRSTTVSLLSMFCGAAVLLLPLTFTPILAAPHSSASGHAPQPAAIERIGDAVETAADDDDDEDDELEVSGGDCCEHGGDVELLYPNSEDSEEDDDKDYSSDDRYA